MIFHFRTQRNHSNRHSCANIHCRIAWIIYFDQFWHQSRQNSWETGDKKLNYLIWNYRIRPNYRTDPYKRIVKQFLSLQITYLQITYYLLLYKSICCWYSLELPRLVKAIQMSTNNICFHKENQKTNRISIIKYTLIQIPAYLSCKFVLIR